MTRNIESENDYFREEAHLWLPPQGEEVAAGPWSADAEMAAFESFKAAFTK